MPHPTLISTIQSDLDATRWMLLFFGWLMYWLKTMNSSRTQYAGAPFLMAWWKDNFIEIPSSVIACFVLAMLAREIPTDLIDLKGLLSVFITGYSSSSILNGLITNFKPTQK